MTDTRLHISATVQLRNGSFFRNGKEVVQVAESEDFNDWLKQSYRELDMQYPKFHKMDSLSKLAVLNAEILLHKQPIYSDRSKIGLLLYNKHSSIDSDTRHQALIMDEQSPLPSPAVFVYTLPNIMLGEICIRHKITGENLCLIAPEFEADSAINQCEMLFRSGMKQVLIGWVDTFNGSGKSWMALVQKDGNAPNNSQLSAQILNELDNIPEWKH